MSRDRGVTRDHLHPTDAAVEDGASDVSVVIACYTPARWDHLAAAVWSVQGQTLPAREIVVVVDHNSTLLERVRQELPEVVAVENTAARGLSGARNSGIAATTGDIIAFLDDDAVADREWLARLTEPIRRVGVIGAGGAVVPLWAGGRPAWFPAEFQWVVGCSYEGLPESAAPVRNMIGCNMAFRRSVFALVGGFSNGIGRIGTRPVGCEETELCIRARQHWPESEMIYEPAAVVHHLVPQGRATLRYFVARCYAEGLSKALVARLVGARDGLAAERSYTLRVLPRGIGRGVRDAATRGDAAGIGRAGAIALGLATTTLGYAAGKVLRARAEADVPVGRSSEPAEARMV